MIAGTAVPIDVGVNNHVVQHVTEKLVDIR